MDETKTITGSCHCGATRFEATHPPEETFMCACDLCRKRGTIWVRYASEAFRLQNPADDVGIYRTEGNKAAHHFCRGCGCVTYSVSDSKTLWVNARLMDAIDIDPLPAHRLEVSHG